ncbi:asparagine synthase C-terminal domain-containing protein [Helicobacter sp. MIT 05-5293]|uniref:asparagine synthase-related protein n=1 Tax=Helicobacter sp. MIT 05-5293 TaxID=1548149 RepID=UPI00131522F6|nr:asparagine synthase C-terminal domain-containing protein [Helicobacter sp. MIT 05-5293]
MDTQTFFGIHNTFYQSLDNPFNDLSQAIVQNGFSDYSKYGITSFFVFRYPILQYTMFEGFFRKVDFAKSPNNHLTFSTRNLSLQKAVDIAEYLLLESLDSKVGNAARIGILLSGGLDSSLLVAMCKRIFPNRDIYTYSMGFYGDDEFEYSDEVAKLFSSKHSKQILNADDYFGTNSLLPSLIKQKAAPLHPNELPLAIAETKARKDCCDIILCGEGADDVFGGYSHNLAMYLSYQNDKQSFFRHILQEYRYFSMDKIRSLVHEKYLVDDCEMIAPLFEQDTLPHHLQDVMLYFIQMLHTRGLIERGMNALRYNGFAEGFVFLDSALLTFVNSLPFDFKLHILQVENAQKHISSLKGDYKAFSDSHCIAKFLLKEIAKSYLPESIIYRVKKGFPVPFALWDKQSPIMPNLNAHIFKDNSLSTLNAWEKFMVYNLNTFINVFDSYRLRGGGQNSLIACLIAFLFRSFLFLILFLSTLQILTHTILPKERQ